jgi:hypothetical protein
VTPSPAAPRITEVTRRKILDSISLGVWWAGRLDEPDFLRRIYEIEKLPSYDTRYSSALGDIRQHRVNNPTDWPDDWIFSDDRFGLTNGADEVLLRFLAEMLHPIVRPDENEVQSLLRTFNDALGRDGYELYPSDRISGHAIYGWRAREGFHGASPDLLLESRTNLTDPRVLQEHLTRIRNDLVNDPAAAISSCKNLVESLCKIILEGSRVAYPENDDLPKLYRKVAELLSLNAESVPESARGSQASQQILRTLSTTVQALAELRNALGLGHGQATSSAAYARHARLALNSTVTVTEFLLDTWQDRIDTGRLVLPA